MFCRFYNLTRRGGGGGVFQSYSHCNWQPCLHKFGSFNFNCNILTTYYSISGRIIHRLYRKIAVDPWKFALTTRRFLRGSEIILPEFFFTFMDMEACQVLTQDKWYSTHCDQFLTLLVKDQQSLCDGKLSVVRPPVHFWVVGALTPTHIHGSL